MNSYPTPTETDPQAQAQQAQRQLQQVHRQMADALGAIERATENVSGRIHGTPNAMKDGAGNAIDLVSTNVKSTLKHSNPKHPARSIGFWLLMLGVLTAITGLLDACNGAVSGVASNQPLPHNAPATAKATNATVRGVKLVTQLGSPLVEELDSGYRTLLVRQQQGGAIQNTGPIPLDRSRILEVRTNVERYQSR